MFFAPIQGVDLRHLFLCQKEVEQFGIFLNVGRIAGAGNDHYALLQVPAEDYLRWGFPMSKRYSSNCLFSKSPLVYPLPPRGYHPCTAMPRLWI